MTTPHPSGHPAGTRRATVAVLTDVDRVIPGAAYRAAAAFLEDTADQLRGFTCAERVTAVVAVLVTPAGEAEFTGADLMAALREVDTIDCALDLLDRAGLGCGA